jgi:hypothetical protein
MMSVDRFFSQNGRQFVSMAGWDDEMDRMGRTRRPREDHPIDVCDLLGRKYTADSESDCVWQCHTTDSQLRLEETF